ncbi:hypothetical protein BDZ45DRAFT_597305, partial [Acephala macrosclerotiorum]
SLVSDRLVSLSINFDATILLIDIMRDTRFTNVTTRIFYVPINRWPNNKTLKTVELYWKAVLLDSTQAIALGSMTRGLKWRREQVEMRLVEIRKKYIDKQIHSHMPLHIIYEQRLKERIVIAISD